MVTSDVKLESPLNRCPAVLAEATDRKLKEGAETAQDLSDLALGLENDMQILGE